MSMTFDNAGVIESFDNLPDGEFVYQTTVNFPADFAIRLAGKEPGDTQVDSNGNIVKDKYIKIVNIEVDGLPCRQHYVHQNITLHTADNQEIVTSYWGFNGTVTLDFSEANSFFWALHSVD